MIRHKLKEEADETNTMLHDINATTLQLPHLLTVAPTHMLQFFQFTKKFRNRTQSAYQGLTVLTVLPSNQRMGGV